MACCGSRHERSPDQTQGEPRGLSLLHRTLIIDAKVIDITSGCSTGRIDDPAFEIGDDEAAVSNALAVHRACPEPHV